MLEPLEVAAPDDSDVDILVTEPKGVASLLTIPFERLTARDVRWHLVYLISLRATTILGTSPLDLSHFDRFPSNFLSLSLQDMVRELVAPCRECILSLRDDDIVAHHKG